MSALTKRPLTLPEIDAMDSATYRWHEFNNFENLHKALNPPPPPSAKELRAAEAAEVTKEFQAWCAKNNRKVPDVLDPAHDFIFASFFEERDRPNKIKAIEEDVTRWMKSHPEYIPSESSRIAISEYLDEHKLAINFANLEVAFQALVKSGDIAVQPPDTSPKQQQFRNGELIHVTPTDRRNTDPSRAASTEKTVTKRVSQQSASEFLQNLIDSPSFKKRIDS
jgi:hypothetical protein